MAQKSKFTIIPKNELSEYGNMIMLKKISYPQLLKHLKDEFTELGNISAEALRKFMILNHYVLNENSYNKINKNIQKQEFLRQKRKIKVETIIEEILENKIVQEELLNDEDFIKKLFATTYFKENVIKLIIKILEKK